MIRRRRQRERDAWSTLVAHPDLFVDAPAALDDRRLVPVTSERDVLKACLDVCERHPRVGFAWRQNVGAVRYAGKDGKQRFVSFGFAGLSDIGGVMADGRVLMIEVKRPGKKETAEQQAFLVKIAAYGGVAVVVDDAAALWRFLDTV